MDNRSSTTSSTLDQVSLGLSGLCLVHCLFFPVIVAALPFFDQLSAGHFHVQMLAVVVPVSVIALSLGYRRHRNIAVLPFGALGMLLLIVGGTIVHDSYGLTADRVFTITGAVALAVTHYFNTRLSSHCRS